MWSVKAYTMEWNATGSLFRASTCHDHAVIWRSVNGSRCYFWIHVICLALRTLLLVVLRRVPIRFSQYMRSNRLAGPFFWSPDLLGLRQEKFLQESFWHHALTPNRPLQYESDTIERVFQTKRYLTQSFCGSEQKWVQHNITRIGIDRRTTDACFELFFIHSDYLNATLHGVEVWQIKHARCTRERSPIGWFSKAAIQLCWW